MNRHRLLRCLIAVSLLAAFCPISPRSIAEEPPNRTDSELRTFLGIRSFPIDYELPEDTDAYYPIAIFFAEGKELGFAKGPVLLRTQSSPHKGRIEVMWQFQDGVFRRAALVDGANSKDLGDNFPHWKEFASASWRKVGLKEGLMYQGIPIVGIVGNDLAQLYPESDKLPSAAKYLVAIGLVYGRDHQALLNRFMSKSEK